MFSQLHLSMKEGCLFVLFCTSGIHGTGMFQIILVLSLESSQGGGVDGLGMQKFFNIE